MDVIRKDFDQRCQAVRSFCEHVKALTNSKGTVKICVILKSSIFIAIYNNIEATFLSVFEKIHSEACCFKYEMLSDEFKRFIER